MSELDEWDALWLVNPVLAEEMENPGYSMRSNAEIVRGWETGGTKVAESHRKKRRDYGDWIISECRRRISLNGISFHSKHLNLHRQCEACGCCESDVVAYNGMQPIWGMCDRCMDEVRCP